MSGQRGAETGDRYAEWDAAYVLGALSSVERLEFEAHLGSCAACSARVAEMAGMPGILGRLDEASAEELRDLPADADAPVRTEGAVAHLARRVHRRRRVAALAGQPRSWRPPSAVRPSAAPRPGPPPQPRGSSPSAAPPSPPSSPSLPCRGARGSRGPATTRRPAGARMRRRSYRLVVTTTAGRTATVATWGAHGDGASGLAAATSIPERSIRTVEIRTDAGGVLARASLAG